MGIVRTDRDLEKLYYSPSKLCEKLEPYFDGTSGGEIYDHLVTFGMYRPYRGGIKVVEKLSAAGVWETAESEFLELKQAWEGPDVPVFIYPSDSRNERIKREFKGKSGLAFKDKLFLFLSEGNSDLEIRAILIHEYNHAARINKVKKNERDFTLLDSVIMEGLAENAVVERLGATEAASWTNKYTERQLRDIWEKFIKPNKDIPRSHRKHHDLLYGTKFIPRMAGYCAGYYLVRKFIEKEKLSGKNLLKISSEEIVSTIFH